MSSRFTILAGRAINALAPRGAGWKGAMMDNPLLILDLMRAFYWFDEQLRARRDLRRLLKSCK